MRSYINNNFPFLAGVIDEDYRGTVKVILFNFEDKEFEVKKGDRIAQLICEKIFYPDLKEEMVISFININYFK